MDIKKEINKYSKQGFCSFTFEKMVYDKNQNKKIVMDYQLENKERQLNQRNHFTMKVIKV